MLLDIFEHIYINRADEDLEKYGFFTDKISYLSRTKEVEYRIQLSMLPENLATLMMKCALSRVRQHRMQFT